MTIAFGDIDAIKRNKKHEARTGFKAELDALLEKYYMLDPDEVASIMAYAAKDFYRESDVRDIYQFAAMMRRRLLEATR